MLAQKLTIYECQISSTFNIRKTSEKVYECVLIYNMHRYSGNDYLKTITNTHAFYFLHLIFNHNLIMGHQVFPVCFFFFVFFPSVPFFIWEETFILLG